MEKKDKAIRKDSLSVHDLIDLPVDEMRIFQLPDRLSVLSGKSTASYYNRSFGAKTGDMVRIIFGWADMCLYVVKIRREAPKC